MIILPKLLIRVGRPNCFGFKGASQAHKLPSIEPEETGFSLVRIRCLLGIVPWKIFNARTIDFLNANSVMSGRVRQKTRLLRAARKDNNRFLTYVRNDKDGLGRGVAEES